jgi:hypothetical protein
MAETEDEWRSRQRAERDQRPAEVEKSFRKASQHDPGQQVRDTAISMQDRRERNAPGRQGGGRRPTYDFSEPLSWRAAWPAAMHNRVTGKIRAIHDPLR